LPILTAHPGDVSSVTPSKRVYGKQKIFNDKDIGENTYIE